MRHENYPTEYLKKHYKEQEKTEKDYDNALFIVGLVLISIVFIIFVKSV